MIIKEGSIIPNVGIGSYLLDITKKELLDIIGNNYKETMRNFGLQKMDMLALADLGAVSFSISTR